MILRCTEGERWRCERAKSDAGTVEVQEFSMVLGEYLSRESNAPGLLLPGRCKSHN